MHCCTSNCAPSRVSAPSTRRRRRCVSEFSVREMRTTIPIIAPLVAGPPATAASQRVLQLCMMSSRESKFGANTMRPAAGVYECTEEKRVKTAVGSQDTSDSWSDTLWGTPYVAFDAVGGVGG